MKAPLPPCLAYAGALGHAWIVLVRPAGGAWRVRAEVNAGPDAARYHDEALAEGLEAAVYRRTWRSRRGGTVGVWSLVRPSLAAIS